MVAGKMRYGWVNQSPMRDGVAYEDLREPLNGLKP